MEREDRNVEARGGKEIYKRVKSKREGKTEDREWREKRRERERLK